MRSKNNQNPEMGSLERISLDKNVHLLTSGILIIILKLLSTCCQNGKSPQCTRYRRSKRFEGVDKKIEFQKWAKLTLTEDTKETQNLIFHIC